MNERLVEIISELVEHYEALGEESIWERSGNIDNALRKLADNVRRYREELTELTGHDFREEE